MNSRPNFLLLIALILISFSHLGMSSRGQYDEDARREEAQAKELARQQKTKKSLSDGPKGIVSGVKQATVDSASGLIAETAQGTKEAPVTGTIEGVRKGSEAVLDNTVKGVAKVATLGYGDVDHIDVVEPEEHSGDTTKIKIKF